MTYGSLESVLSVMGVDVEIRGARGGALKALRDSHSPSALESITGVTGQGALSTGGPGGGWMRPSVEK
jgi:hypothetical protein